MAAIDITPILKLMLEQTASDLFFSCGSPVHIKREGETSAVNTQIMQPGMIKAIAYALMNAQQIDDFESTLEANFAIARPDIGRFRINVFKQRGEVGMVIRHIKTDIPTLDSLGLPAILKELVMRKRGLILVVGATGSGKTTTLASMIDHRNTNSHGHILTLEDPIEFMHEHKKSVVDQREIGVDTWSFDNGLKNAMRQAPDLILIGEIRDKDGMKNALAYAETGHLCLATLHANNTNQAIERVVSFFPEEGRASLLMAMSMNLVSIVSQRLVSGIDNKRISATEVMINTPYVAELIQKHRLSELKEVMANNNDIGMITFDQALFKQFANAKISEENALANADSRNDLSLRIRFAAEAARRPSLSSI